MLTVLPNPLAAEWLSLEISSVCHAQNEEKKDDENRITGEYGVPVHFFFQLCTKLNLLSR